MRAALADARPGGRLHGAAAQVAAQIAAMPPPADTALVLEALATGAPAAGQM